MRINMCAQSLVACVLCGLVMAVNIHAADEGLRTIEIIRGNERIEVPVPNEPSDEQPGVIEVIRGSERIQVSIQEEPAASTSRTTDYTPEINEQNYEQEIFDAKIPVFVQFYSSKSLGCKIQSPLVAELARSYAGKVKFVTIDVDKHPALALAFNISKLPTLMVKQPGVDDTLVARGFLESEDLKRFLSEGLKPTEPSGK